MDKTIANEAVDANNVLFSVFESLIYIYSPKDIVIVTLELIGTDLLSLGLNHNIDCFGY